MSVLARPELAEELPMLAGDSEISLLLGLTPAQISQLVRAEQMPQPRQRLKTNRREYAVRRAATDWPAFRSAG